MAAHVHPSDHDGGISGEDAHGNLESSLGVSH